MEARSFLIDDSVWIDADRIPVSGCGSACLDHSDGKSCFQSSFLQLVKTCWEVFWWSCQCLLFQGFQIIIPLRFQSKFRVGVFVDCIEIIYSPFQNKSSRKLPPHTHAENTPNKTDPNSQDSLFV